MSREVDQNAANNIRALAVAMVEKAKSGHPGGPMGGADFMHILYTEFLRFDPSDMFWQSRDRFFMDAGHLSALMYAQYHLLGWFSQNDLQNFRQWGSVTPGHPELDVARGIENTSGPLGQGHVMGVGAAIAAKFLASRFGDWMDQKIYGFISDGGIQEEISQGAGRIAGHLGLNNFILFFDSNDIQLSTETSEVTSEDTALKYQAWGWKVLTINGHDHEQIRQALKEATAEREKPILIIGKTVIGKGCVDAAGNPYEGHTELHGKPIGNTGADYDKTLKNLGSSTETAFDTFTDVAVFYKEVLERKKQEAAQLKGKESQWREKNPEKAAKLDAFFSKSIPALDFSAIEQKPDQATRASSSTVLGYLAGKVENLIVSSADLSNSDKTDGFLKETTVFKKGDFSGSFLQSGVAEFTMAALANGMALHGGVIPVVGTFFVFSDYMKPAVRLGAIMELPVIYVWTHDAFRVGEDGPTHQPIEQEAQIRLLEKVKNHSGNPGFIALRPADAAETTVAWEWALKNRKCSTGLILSRQNVKNLPNNGQTAWQRAQGLNKGGYLVVQNSDAQVSLIANGSEVATLVEAAKVLKENDNINANVVSIPSEALFKSQRLEYQEKILPASLPVFGLTAGLPVNLEGLVGNRGMVYGLSHFGYSAPAKVLDEKFGFTPDNISEKIIGYLESIEAKEKI